MKSCQLIIDIGGTSGRWITFNHEKSIEHLTKGFNPFQSPWENFEAMAREAYQKTMLLPHTIELFGAGFVTEEQKSKATQILQKVFSADNISIYSDIMLVAKATPVSSKKVVIILGTGCNSMLCFNNTFVQKAAPLGFALGDDGSGAYMGRALLRAYFYKKLDPELEARLEEFQPLSRITVAEHIYRGDNPAGYLGSYFPFLLRYKTHPSIAAIISEALTDHFANIISLYPKDSVFHYSGSVAWCLEKELREIFRENGLSLGKIIKEPLRELIKSIQQND